MQNSKKRRHDEGAPLHHIHPNLFQFYFSFFFQATNISPLNVGAAKTETKINILSSFFTKDKKAKATPVPEKKVTTPVVTDVGHQEASQADHFKEFSVAIEKGRYGFGLRCTSKIDM